MPIEDYSDTELGAFLKLSQRNAEKFDSYRKYSFLFDKFPEDIRERWLASASLDVNEVPIYGTFRSDQHWILITTRRYIWLDFLSDAGRQSLKYRDMTCATAAATAQDPRYPQDVEVYIGNKCPIPGKPPADYREKYLAPPYDQLMSPNILSPWLLLGDRGGRFYEIYVEKGAVVGGTYNNIFEIMTLPGYFDKVHRKYNG